MTNGKIKRTYDWLKSAQGIVAIVLSTLGAVVYGAWVSVTWAQDKLEKIEQVPVMQQSIQDIKASMDQLMEHDDVVAEEVRQSNAAVIEKLDELLRARTD